MYQLEVRLVILDVPSFPSTDLFEYYRSYVFWHFISTIKCERDSILQTLGIKKSRRRNLLGATIRMYALS